MREIADFRFDFVCKTGPINAFSTPSSRSWDDRVVTDFVVKFDYDGKMVGAATTLCWSPRCFRWSVAPTKADVVGAVITVEDRLNTVSVPLINFQLLSRSSRQKMWPRWVSRSRELTICRFRCTILLNVRALFTFPMVIASRGFRTSAAFLMESLGTYAAPYWDSVRA